MDKEDAEKLHTQITCMLNRFYSSECHTEEQQKSFCFTLLAYASSTVYLSSKNIGKTHEFIQNSINAGIRAGQNV